MLEGCLEGCPCWRVLPEELGIDGVDRGEILDVLEKHRGLHHVPVVAASSLDKVLHVDYFDQADLEDVPHVDQGLPGLLLHPGHQLPVRLNQQYPHHLSQCVKAYHLQAQLARHKQGLLALHQDGRAVSTQGLWACSR